MFQKLAEEAEEKIEDTDPPLFLRFINLLINDAIFLLDEAFDVSTRCLKSVDTMYIFFFYTSEFFNMKNVTIMLELFNAKHEIHVHIMYTCISNYCFATVYDPDKGQAG